MQQLISPNGLIQIVAQTHENSWPTLHAYYLGTDLFLCELGIQTNRQVLPGRGEMELLSQDSLLDHYTLPAGKLAAYTNQGNEQVLQVANGIVLRLRAYNNGIAFRYELDARDDSLVIADENTNFRISAGFDSIYAQELVSTYELPYLPRSWRAMEGQRYGMPMLISTCPDQGPYMLFSEAQVLSSSGNYCSCHFTVGAEQDLRIAFAPEDNGKAMAVNQPFYSPWRIITIVGSLGELVRSHLAHDVNPPSMLESSPWVAPARSLWAWWAYENGAQLYTQSRDYIDYAAAMGFEAVTLDCGWDANWVPTLCDYARKRRVQIWLWTAMKRVDTREKAEHYLPLWASWGVAGLKIDFFENDSQHTMSVYCILAELAAEHQLMLNFHGSTKPMGEGRTWPHFISSEGIMGLEHYKWSDMPDSMHNCTIPFLRNVSGPMDYTPLGFANRNRNTTHAHQLALTLIFESGITHYSLALSELEPWPGTGFLRYSKAKYDDVQLLSGIPGDHVIMVRSKDYEYLLGAIATSKRIVTIDLSFLPEGDYEAEIFEDDAKDQMLRVRRQSVNHHTKLSLPLLQNGGAAVYIAKSIHPMPNVSQRGYMGERFVNAPAEALHLGDGSERFHWPNGMPGILLLGSVYSPVPPSENNGQTLKIWYACDEKTIVQVLHAGYSKEITLPATSTKWNLTSLSFPVGPCKRDGTLELKRMSGGIPAIARVILVDSGFREGTRYAAKDANLPQSAVLVQKKSGALDAAQLGNGPGITFAQVQAEESGWHVLSIEYCGGDSRDVSVEINSESRIDTYLHSTAGWFFPTWENAEEKELLVYLNKGNNTIRLFNSEGEMSHIRSIHIRYDEPSNEPGAVTPQ